MKALSAHITRGIPVTSLIETCDNSGAKIVRIMSIRGAKTVRRRRAAAAIGDLMNVAVIEGTPEMRKQIALAVLVRQKKEYRRPDGTRIKFEDNAVVILKDEMGTPKGTIFKGPIAKEAVERWPQLAKVASIVI